MAVTVATAGTAAWAAPAGFVFPKPANHSVQVNVAPNTVPGQWLVACVTWRQATAGAGVTASIADDAHNFWEPLGAPSGDSSAAGVTRTAWWYAPAARACSYVLAAPTGPWLSAAVAVYSVAGLAPWFTLTAILPGFANAATALSLGLGAPAASALVFAGAGSDNNADTVTLTAGGWTALTSALEASNGTDHTGDIRMDTAWQVTSGAVTAAWTASGALDFSGVTAGFLVTASAPVQPNPNWPVTITEVAPGAGPGTPPSQITWVPASTRSLDMKITQGRQYTLAQLQAGQGTMLLDDPDGALIPPGTGAYAGIDSGTPVRQRMIWQGGAWQVQFNGTGAIANPGAASQLLGGITAGNAYNAAAWMMSPQGWATTQVNIAWYTAGSVLISTSAGTVTATPAGQVTLVTSGPLTAPATATQAIVILQMTGTPAATVVMQATAVSPAAGWLSNSALTWAAQNSATVTTLAPWKYDRRGAPVPAPYFVPFSGYFQRWPFNLDTALLRGQAQATIIDTWGYAGTLLNSMLRQEILADSPYAYWPLDDPAGSASAANIAPGNQNPLNLSTSKLGAGGATQVFGANSGVLTGDTSATISTSKSATASAGMWSQVLAGTSLTTNGFGYALTCFDTAFPSITAGVTIESWLQSASATPPATWEMIIWSARNAHGGVIELAVSQTNGNLILNSYSQAGALATVVVDAAYDFRTTTNIVAVAVSFTQAAYQVYVTGSLVASGTFASPIVARFAEISFGGRLSRTGTGYMWAGFSAHAAVYPAQVAAGRILSHYIAGFGTNGAMLFEAADARAERILGYAALAGRRCILQQGTLVESAAEAAGETDQMVSGKDIGAQPAATSLSNIAASTQPAMLYVAPTGDIVYLAKQYAWNQNAKWVLGDSAAAGEIPFLPDMATDYDPARVINNIQITELDTGSVTVPSPAAAEAASAAQYGQQSYQVTGYLVFDTTNGYPYSGQLAGNTSPFYYYSGSSLGDLANWLAWTYRKPRQRIQQVTVDAARNPAAWAFVAGASVGDMVIVNERPPTMGGALVVSVTGRVTQTARSTMYGQGGTAGSVTCVIDYAAEANVLQCDDPVHGLLNGTQVFAW